MLASFIAYTTSDFNMRFLYALFPMLFYTGLSFGQNKHHELFDYYYVPYRGDTIREGIVKIDLRHKRKVGLVARIRFINGKVLRLGSREVRAFSFVSYTNIKFRMRAIYHQVEVLPFSNLDGKPRVSKFYETLGECNGYKLYREIHWDDQYWRYLLSRNGVMIEEIHPHRRNDTREHLAEIMPDCLQQLDYALWPGWAMKHYRPAAPVKPQF